MALATTADVEAILQGDINPDNDPIIVNLLDQASTVVENEVGRELEAVAYTTRLHSVPNPNDGQIFLRHWPIASVEALEEDGTPLVEDTDFTVDLELGIITRISSGVVIPWLPGHNVVDVDYTAVTPGIARTETARLVAEAFVGGRAYAIRNQTGPGGAMAGLRQLTIGRWSATAETGAGAGTIGIVVDELARSRLQAIKTRTP